MAKKHKLFLISDEVYKDFVFSKEKLFSLAEMPELRKKSSAFSVFPKLML